MLSSDTTPSLRYTCAVSDDADLVDRSRDGDEAAFEALVRRHHASLVRIARLYVASEATAEEVAQETWIAVLNGLDRFEGRSSFRTWCVRILMNIARRRGSHDAKVIPFSSTTRLADDPYDGAVDSALLKPGDDPVQPLHWAAYPRRWEIPPDDQATYVELVAELRVALDDLSPAQREVVTLRDVLG